jgi:putative endonuclease
MVPGRDCLPPEADSPREKRMAYCVYIMTNKINTVLYTGYSSVLPGRVLNHKEKIVDGFTKRYNVNKLVHYEAGESREGALWREKQIKSWSRKK